MTDGFDIIEILEHIDPSRLNYQEWVNVGMALKEEGHTAADWDVWSRRDAGGTIRGMFSEMGFFPGDSAACNRRYYCADGKRPGMAA